MKDKDRWAHFVEKGLEGRNLHEPPDHVLRKAIDLGKRLERPSIPSLLDCVRLLFDSAAAPLPVGVRGAATGPRRLLYTVGSEQQPELFELDLQLRRRETGGIDLTGQLLPPLAGSKVEFVAGSLSRSIAIEDSGEFRFRNLRSSAQVAEIRIWSADHEFGVAEVPLARERSDE